LKIENAATVTVSSVCILKTDSGNSLSSFFTFNFYPPPLPKNYFLTSSPLMSSITDMTAAAVTAMVEIARQPEQR
jgi:hypothetical protein